MKRKKRKKRIVHPTAMERIELGGCVKTGSRCGAVCARDGGANKVRLGSSRSGAHANDFGAEEGFPLSVGTTCRMFNPAPIAKLNSLGSIGAERSRIQVKPRRHAQPAAAGALF